MYGSFKAADWSVFTAEKRTIPKACRYHGLQIINDVTMADVETNLNSD